MRKLIEHITSDLSSSINLQLTDSKDGFDFFEITQENDTINLTGNNNVSLALSYNYFLKNHCNTELSLSGDNSIYEIEKILPVKKTVSQKVLQKFRMCMDYETYSNEAVFWNYDRFEKELEIMAMNGVNLVPMFIGYEAVLYYSFLELGINREDSMEFLSSPSYFPYQLSGKLDTILPMTDTAYLKSRIELGKKILQRMQELGIKPILPIFSGHVPKYFKGYFSDASLIINTPFGEYPYTYRIDPAHPVFEKVSKTILEKQKEFFGTAEFYICDPFYGVSPRGHYKELISNYGKAVSALIGDATLVTHACEHTLSFVSGLNKDKVLIIDKDGSEYKNKNGFSGYPFIVGTHINKDGHTSLHGSVEEITSNTYLTASKKYDNAVGCGVFADSHTDNPHISSLALEMLCCDKSLDAFDWIKTFSTRRWGSDEKCLKEAAELLLKTCYSKENSGPVTGSIIAARPSTQLSHTAPFDTLELRYDNKELCKALELLLSSEEDYTEEYVFDACNILRQLLSNYARVLYSGAINGYNNRDSRLFEISTNKFMRLIADMDRLLLSHPDFSLFEKLKMVGDSAINKFDRQNFEIAFLSSVTIFGPFNNPEHYDLLWREWSCLVGDYYAKRWHAFFTMLAERFSKRRTISTVCKKQVNGRNHSIGNKFYKNLDKTERQWIKTCSPNKDSNEDTLDIVTELFNKYKSTILSDIIQ